MIFLRMSLSSMQGLELGVLNEKLQNLFKGDSTGTDVNF